MAWGGLVSTGAYSGAELAGMAVPLLAAALVEWREASLFRFRRVLELVALGVFLFQVVARTGVLSTVVFTLFTLCGVRLCLPRELPQRRQLLLMGFLLFLSTAVSTSDLDFLVWSLLWTAGGAAYLLQLDWDKSALPRQGPPPFRRIPAWAAAAALLAASFFVVLPRLRMGVRNLPVGVQSFAGAQAGVSAVLDLSGKGPIQGSAEVALRLVPKDGPQGFEEAFTLLKAFVLEDLQGQRWERSRMTPRRTTARWEEFQLGGRPLEADLFVSPTTSTAVPLPYGLLELRPPEGERLRSGPAGAVEWAFPVRRIRAVLIRLRPQILEPEPPPAGQRMEQLLSPGRGTESALRWSLAKAPGAPPPRVLAAQLTQALRTYRYTLDNPSGGAANPIQDFLERSQAGHCEYFASSLAIMLRHRGVPARVVNGYRLGPWIQEGGYFLVTQNEAHSWVEYYDRSARGWFVADPTPPAPPSLLGTGSLGAAMARLGDALRFRWDRSVVRFSDEDQVAGFSWIQARVDRWNLGAVGPRLKAALVALAALLGVGALLRARGAFLPRLGQGASRGPGRLPQLRPLLRAAGREVPPRPGETARAWLERLGTLHPSRAAALEVLAREADAAAYGGRVPDTLGRLAKAEAKEWKAHARKKPVPTFCP
jgi:transglutaminase-like putative cysteine protease